MAVGFIGAYSLIFDVQGNETDAAEESQVVDAGLDLVEGLEASLEDPAGTQTALDFESQEPLD